MTSTTMSLDFDTLAALYHPFQPPPEHGWASHDGYLGIYFISQGSEYILQKPVASDPTTQVPSSDLAQCIDGFTNFIVKAVGDDKTYASLVSSLNAWNDAIQAGGTVQVMTVNASVIHIRNNTGDDKADLTYTYVLCPLDASQSVALLMQHTCDIDWAGTLMSTSYDFAKAIGTYAGILKNALKVAELSVEAVPGLDVIATIGLVCKAADAFYKFFVAEADDGGRLNFMGVIAHALVRISSCVLPRSTFRGQVAGLQAQNIQTAWYGASVNASPISMIGVTTPYQAGVYFGMYPSNQVMFASKMYDVMYNQPYVINMPELSWPLGALPLTFATVKVYSDSRAINSSQGEEQVYVLLFVIYGPGGNAVMALAQCTEGPASLPAPVGTDWFPSSDKETINSDFAGVLFSQIETFQTYTQPTRQLYYVISPLAEAICKAMVMTKGPGSQPLSLFALSTGAATTYDSGIAPSVAVRPDGIVVSSYSYHPTLSIDPNVSDLHQNCGTLGASAGTVNWPNADNGKKYDSGSWPTIAANPTDPSGDILDFHNGFTNNIYWESGSIDTSNTTVKFSGKGTEGPSDGDHPAVYLGGDNVMIVMYAPGNNNMAYNIGRFSGSTVSCSNWSVVNYSAGNPSAVVSGDYPTITRNGDAVLEVHNEKGQIWYNIGTLDLDTSTITWQPGPFPLLQNGSHPHLALLDDDRFLLTYDNAGKIYAASGSFSSSGAITWYLTNLSVCDGNYPAIAYAPNHSPGDTVVMVYNDNGNLYSRVCAGLFPTGKARGDTMTAGQALGLNQSLYSPNGQFQLIMQSDGNLVLYRADGAVMWSSNTSGQPATMCIMQSDGNLVVYGGAIVTWNSNTPGNYGSYLIVEDSGQIVIYDSDGGWKWGKP